MNFIAKIVQGIGRLSAIPRWQGRIAQSLDRLKADQGDIRQLTQDADFCRDLVNAIDHYAGNNLYADHLLAERAHGIAIHHLDIAPPTAASLRQLAHAVQSAQPDAVLISQNGNNAPPFWFAKWPVRQAGFRNLAQHLDIPIPDASPQQRGKTDPILNAPKEAVSDWVFLLGALADQKYRVPTNQEWTRGMEFLLGMPAIARERQRADLFHTAESFQKVTRSADPLYELNVEAKTKAFRLIHVGLWDVHPGLARSLPTKKNTTFRLVADAGPFWPVQPDDEDF